VVAPLVEVELAERGFGFASKYVDQRGSALDETHEQFEVVQVEQCQWLYRPLLEAAGGVLLDVVPEELALEEVAGGDDDGPDAAYAGAVDVGDVCLAVEQCGDTAVEFGARSRTSLLRSELTLSQVARTRLVSVSRPPGDLEQHEVRRAVDGDVGGLSAAALAIALLAVDDA
jgi:hypothetical protein